MGQEASVSSVSTITNPTPADQRCAQRSGVSLVSTLPAAGSVSYSNNELPEQVYDTYCLYIEGMEMPQKKTLDDSILNEDFCTVQSILDNCEIESKRLFATLKMSQLEYLIENK
jgi:hypothetical protein